MVGNTHPQMLQLSVRDLMLGCGGGEANVGSNRENGVGVA